MPTEDKMKSFDDDNNHFVNAEDGLTLDALDVENSLRHRNQLIELQLLVEEAGGRLDGLSLDDVTSEDDFPTNLIISGLSPEFFEDTALRRNFEEEFKSHGDDAAFVYFKSFKRVRVTYESAGSAIRARIKMHLRRMGDDELKCHFGYSISMKKKGDGFLHPPTPDKQFLISPPASPPVGWEPCPEGSPNVNFDLITALTKLAPGEAHEVHKPEEASHPSIVVHIADEEERADWMPKPKIMHTKRPQT